MSGLIKSLMVKVGVDLNELQKGMKQAGKEMKSVGKELTETGKNLTAGLTLPIVGAGIAAVKYASDMEESLNKVRVAFGPAAGEVEKFADTSLKSFGIAKGSALDIAATYGDMGTAMGIVPERAAEMSTSLTGLAGDLASFKNIGLDQASVALRGVFTGEGEALKTLGIVMQESTLEAYALAQGMTKTYKDMSQAEKVALRYSFVMDATKNAQGDFARTSDGVANQTRIVTEGLKEAAAAMGESLLPIVAKALGKINELIGKFASLDERTRQNILVWGAAAAAIGPVIMTIGKLNTGIGNLITSAMNASKALGEGAGFLSVIGKMIGPAGAIMIAVAAVAALAAGFAVMRLKATEASREMTAFTEGLKENETEFKNQVKEIQTNANVAKDLARQLYALADKENKSNTEKARMVNLVAQLNKLVPDLSLGIDEQTGSLNKNETAVLNVIAAKKKELELVAHQDRMVALYKERATLTDKVSEAQGRLKTAQEKLDAAAAKSQASGFLALQSGVKEAQTTLDGYNSALGRTQTQIDLVESKFDDLAMGVQTANDAIDESTEKTTALTKDQLKEQARALEEQEKAWEKYYDLLESKEKENMSLMGDISSKGIEMSKLSAKEVKRNLEAQIKDFQNWRGEVARLSKRVPEDVMTELRALGPSATPLIKDLNKMTGEELVKWVGTWQSKSRLAKEAAIEQLGGLPAVAANLGRETAIGFADGMKSKLDYITEQAKMMGKAVPYNVRRVLEIESPSKVMRKIGGYLPEGMAIGIKGNIGMVRSAADNMSKAAIPDVGMDYNSTGRTMYGGQSGVASVSQNTASDLALIINVGGKTVLDTVLTEAQRRNARSGRQVIAVGV